MIPTCPFQTLAFEEYLRPSHHGFVLPAKAQRSLHGLTSGTGYSQINNSPKVDETLSLLVLLANWGANFLDTCFSDYEFPCYGSYRYVFLIEGSCVTVGIQSRNSNVGVLVSQSEAF